MRTIVVVADDVFQSPRSSDGGDRGLGKENAGLGAVLEAWGTGKHGHTSPDLVGSHQQCHVLLLIKFNFRWYLDEFLLPMCDAEPAVCSDWINLFISDGGVS